MPEYFETSAIPLTLAQLSMYEALHSAANLRSTVAMSFKFTGDLNVNAFMSSLQIIVERQDALRIVFYHDDCGQLAQRTREAGTYDRICLYQRVNAASEHQFSSFARRLMALDSLQSWDLTTNVPPFRFRLLRYNARHHAFLATFSQQVVDGAAYSIFPQELWRTYVQQVRGDMSRQDSLPSFIGAAYRQHERDSTNHARRTENFWKMQLEKAERCNFLPGIITATDEASTGPRVNYHIDGKLFEAMKAVTKQRKCSQLNILQCALAATLFKHTQQQYISISLPVDTRRTAERNTLGMYTVSLPMVLERQHNNAELLECVKRQWFEMLKSRHISRGMLKNIPMSRGWIGRNTANNIQLNYILENATSFQTYVDDLRIDYGVYTPNVPMATSEVHLRMVVRPGGVICFLSSNNAGLNEVLAAFPREVETILAI